MKKHIQAIIYLLFLAIAATGCGAKPSQPTVEGAIQALDIQAQKLLEEFKPFLKDEFAEPKIKTLVTKKFLINNSELGLLSLLLVDEVRRLVPDQDKQAPLAPFAIDLQIEVLKNALKAYGKESPTQQFSSFSQQTYAYFKDDTIAEGLAKEIAIHEVFKQMVELKIGLVKPSKA
jgi:hypothetical protein